MKTKVEMITRILLGLLMVVFGLNKFLHFLPMPPMPEKAGAFMGALMATGYFFPFLAITEITIGLLFIINKAKLLAIVMLAPITINILLFHINLDIAGITAGAVVAILHIVQIVINKDKLMFLLGGK